MLDDACHLPHPTDNNFLLKLLATHKNSEFVENGKKLKQNLAFTVKHTTGEVCYDVAGFIQKNRDVIGTDYVKLLSESSLPILKVQTQSTLGPYPHCEA